MYNHITVHYEGKTAFLTINRESFLNALNRETLQEIKTAFLLFKNQENVRGIIITGAGHKAFAAGADIKEFMDFTAEQGKELAKDGHSVMDYIYHFPKPVVAAINGFALGGGLELALACHFRIACEKAKIGLPEVSLGLIPGYGGTQRLSELVGRGKALEMIMTGEMIDARDALNWGAVNAVTTLEDLIPHAISILEKTYIKSGNAISAAIRAVNDYYSKEINGYSTEIDTFGGSFGSPDFNEGVHAFLEKRKPNF